jgi:hypothetical protein
MIEELTSCSECARFKRRSEATGWCSRLGKLVFAASTCSEGIKGEDEK